MTLIAGVVHDGVVWMGGDGLSNDGHNLRFQTRRPKIRRLPVARHGGGVTEMLLGSAGSIRIAQLLQQSLKPPRFKDGQEPYEWALGLATSMEEVLADRQGVFDEDGDVDGVLLMGFEGRMFEVGPDFGVEEVGWDYYAIGSADAIALGVLYATGGQDPQRRVRLALEAAARHDAWVGPPFQVERLPAN